MFRVLHVSRDGFQGDHAHCVTPKATQQCALDAALSEYAHALLTNANVNYSFTIQAASVDDWGTFHAENGVVMNVCDYKTLFRLYHWSADASNRQRLAVRYDRWSINRNTGAPSLRRHAFAAI